MPRPLRHVRVRVHGDPADTAMVVRGLCGPTHPPLCIVERDEGRYALSLSSASEVGPTGPAADVSLVVQPWYNVCANWVGEWNRYFADHAAGEMPRAAMAPVPPAATGQAVVYFLSQYEHFAVVRTRLLFSPDTPGVSQFRVEQQDIADTFRAGAQLARDARVVVGPLCEVADSPDPTRWGMIRDDTVRSLRDQLIDAADLPPEGIIDAQGGLLAYVGLLSFPITAVAVGVPLAYFSAASRSAGAGIVLAVATVAVHLILLITLSKLLPVVRVTRTGINAFAVAVGNQAVSVDEKGAEVCLLQGPVSRVCGIVFPERWRPWAAWFSERKIRAAIADDLQYAADGSVLSLVPPAEVDGTIRNIELVLLVLAIASLALLILFRVIVKLGS